MTESTVVVKSQEGLHARLAAAFVQEGLKYGCRIEVEYVGRKADGKSILQVLSLGVKSSHEIVVRAEGAGEAEAVAALVKVIDAAA